MGSAYRERELLVGAQAKRLRCTNLVTELSEAQKQRDASSELAMKQEELAQLRAEKDQALVAAKAEVEKVSRLNADQLHLREQLIESATATGALARECDNAQAKAERLWEELS